MRATTLPSSDRQAQWSPYVSYVQCEVDADNSSQLLAALQQQESCTDKLSESAVPGFSCLDAAKDCQYCTGIAEERLWAKRWHPVILSASGLTTPLDCVA